MIFKRLSIVGLLAVSTSALAAGNHGSGHEGGSEAHHMTNGAQLFVDLGCVACHAVNGVGGQDHAPLDAEVWGEDATPFDVMARLWASAVPMINMQKEALGGQIFLEGSELEAIVHFLLDGEAQ